MLHTRKEDELVNTVIRVTDWKWLAGIIVAVCAWSVNQWVQYNQLLKEFTVQTTAIIKLTGTVESLALQLNAANTENLKQDFGLTRLKERVDAIEAWKNQVLSVPPIVSNQRK